MAAASSAEVTRAAEDPAAIREQLDRLAVEFNRARLERDEAVQAERAQAETLVSELRRFDEVILERDIRIEDLDCQLASTRKYPGLRAAGPCRGRQASGR